MSPSRQPTGSLNSETIDFMLHRAERTRDGGLSHFNGKPRLWVDTLDMACPVLSHAARITRRPELQLEAVRQLEIFAHHLRDPAIGLWYHTWDEGSGRRTTNFWARGNGWVVLSLVETLKQEPINSPARVRLRSFLDKRLAALVSLQDSPTGLWLTIFPHLGRQAGRRSRWRKMSQGFASVRKPATVEIPVGVGRD
jgi:unsaturated rhamnogalacturonyl hydrolase